MIVPRVILLLVLASVAAQPCSISRLPTLWAKQPGTESKLFAFERDGRVGFIDPTGRIVIQPTIDASIDNVGDFFDGRARIEHVGYVGEDGEWAIRGDYFWVYDFSNGLALVNPSGKGAAHYIDPDGGTVFSAAAFRTHEFSGGLAAYEAKGKPGVRLFEPGKFVYRDFPGLKGFIDKSGAPAIDARFGQVGPFVGDLARATLDGDCYVVTPNGYREGSPTTGYPGSCGGVPDGVESACGAGFIDRTGSFVIQPRFRGATDFGDGLAGVLVDKHWGFVDETGERVIPPAFDQVLPFREGMAAVRVNGLWGFIDKQGETAIEPRFEDVSSFSDSLALVRQGDERFYVDTEGNTVISGPFLEATSFVHGLAAVRYTDRHVAYIDKTGATVFDYFLDPPMSER